MGVCLLFSFAYHLQTDGQGEDNIDFGGFMESMYLRVERKLGLSIVVDGICI